MLLCDIGNTSYHFCNENREYKESVKSFDPSSVKEKVYYICVNKALHVKLHSLSNWIDLSEYIDKKKYYQTMGIDRIFAVEAINEGVIIDAGSAVTVDVVKNNEFVGGFIYPGIQAMRKTYENISPALAYSFNFECDLDIMPKNSQDAISYGYLKTLYSEVMSHNLPVILTGGDALEFKKIFRDAKVDEKLIFNSMKKIILQNEDRLC
ncbi:type III pantothenate kinase [Sulfurimonas sediminis]|uniref:Type III pantothenate kinase n=2 Tax=Sulfurimonas sediminis TaxID=2590020 RepID=A0A7M1B5C5_9BACT|nr:type III pantothenate kinase [Sulfurimonas sediminis]